ncbi:hypothetical protein HCJ52_01725 [Listeria sp. FSL L7-1485]|uniref:Type I restriction modification DNA specificity domain-containing protein n=1 Tax=Listeria immobilis TaxID=2713502 RepID=A0A7X1CA53_9LIST|nr:restriction endonuclease subunit S [Listeria immobilis]MBC1490038.1 hypothetical protein [Listeria immobilis]MBC1534841.1 hypothetical protein [Listeria immobilis]
MVSKWTKVQLPNVLIDQKSAIKIGPFGSQLKKELLQKRGDYRVYGQENVYKNDFSFGDRYLSKEKYEDLKSSEICPNDIVISTMGTIGHCSIVPSNILPGIMDSHLIRLRLDYKKIDYQFFKYILQSEGIQNQIKKMSVGGIMDGLSTSIIKQIEISYPSINEQKKIAESLSDIDKLIDSLSELIKKKLLIKEGVTEEIFSGKRRLQGFWKKWPENTIEELCYLVTKQTGFDYSAKIKPSLVKSKKEDNIPFIQNKDFEGKRINFLTDFYIQIEVAKEFPQILLDEPSLLISISGRIGNVGMFTDKRLAFIGGAVGVAKFKQKKYIEWVMRYLRSNEGQKKIIINEKTGAQSNITVEDIRKITIPIPSIEEQEAIIAILSDIDEEIFKLEENLEKYKKIKQGMMKQLLTGKIRLA